MIVAAPLLGLPAGAGFAQAPSGREDAGRIEGRVVDDETGEALLGASVVVEGTTLGAITGPNGRYSISGLAAGVYRIRASRLGFSDELVEALRVPTNGVVTVDFRLRPQAIALPGVTATAGVSTAARIEAIVESRAEASQAKTAVAGRTAQDFNSANAYDALRIVPGVSYLAGAGGRQGQPSRIRAASAWVIPDAIEDFPTLRPAGIGTEDGGLTAGPGAIIPAIAIERIDVKRGNLGVQYGDVDGGVIVNRLKRGRPGRPTGALWVEANPISEQLYMADAGGGTNAIDYYAAGKFLNGSYEHVRDPNGRTLGAEAFYSGLARVGLNPRESMRIEFFALGGRDRIRYTQPRRDNASTPDVDESKLPPNEFRTTNTNQFYGVTFDHAIGESTSYELGYSYNYDKALRFSVTEGRAHRDRPQVTHSAFGNLYHARMLSAAIGYSARIGFESVWHNQKELALGSTKDQSFQDHSVFSANTFSLGRRLFLNAGVRYLDARDDFAARQLWVYDAGLAYRLPAVRTTARVAYTTGYSRNKGFAYFFGPIHEAGGVEPTLNRTLEAGLDQPWSLGGNRGQLSFTAFRSKNDGVPIFSGASVGKVYYEDQEVRGIELSLEQSLGDRARLFGSFTYMRTEIVATTHPQGVNVGNSGVRVPRYTGALGFEVLPLERLRLSAIATYDDGMRREEIDTVTGEWIITHNEPYTRANLAADHELFRWATVKLRIENLLDEKDLGYGYETIGPNGYTSSQTVAEDPGRFASLGIVVRF